MPSCLLCVVPTTLWSVEPGNSRVNTGGDVLYNGIRLPQTWPPRLKNLPEDPVLPPYLAFPPTVIPIDVGRQLFVDDFLIEQTTLKRTYRRPEFTSTTRF